MKKAHVTHPELKCTFCLDILGIKKNPNGVSYTQLGVVTKGTIIEARTPPPALPLRPSAARHCDLHYPPDSSSLYALTWWLHVCPMRRVVCPP